jgi:hypothetical protein
MSRVGNKQNSVLNGEWAIHVKKWMKRMTAHIRRNEGKKEIRKELNN